MLSNYADASEMIETFSRYPYSAIFFRPGKYGQPDVFRLCPNLDDESPSTGQLSATTADETRAVLHLLDEAAQTDEAGFWLDELAFVRDARMKATQPVLRILPLYQSRLAAQQRVLGGATDEHEDAFGFHPLDGYE